jgi:dihydroorotate dehydrogenase
MYQFFKPLLFNLSPEAAHHWTMRLFRIALSLPFGRRIFKYLFFVDNPRLARRVMGLNFKNPVGLAAGFDKDGKYFEDLTALGFGFIEIGTVTPRPQDGNPTPRLFRLPEDEALINRMGFNNEGVAAMAERLRQAKGSSLRGVEATEGVIIGGNIGKNKTTANEDAAWDYNYCFETLFDYVDYFVVNVSSPNTPNLRALQDREPLTALLAGLQVLNQKKTNPKPILLKIAPDLTDAQLDDIIEIIKETKLAGLVATNTTISRDGLKTYPLRIESIGMGGLSGRPLTHRSTEMIRYLRKNGGSNMVIIGVGGIHTAADAADKLAAGADLLQVYSGLVYEGPALVRKINEGILKDLTQF